MKILILISIIFFGCSNFKIDSLTYDKNNENYYMDFGMGHTIKEISNNGNRILLNDGSTWEIHTMYTRNTVHWFPYADIIVEYNKSPIGEFRYKLINSNDNEEVLAIIAPL